MTTRPTTPEAMVNPTRRPAICCATCKFRDEIPGKGYWQPYCTKFQMNTSDMVVCDVYQAKVIEVTDEP